MELFSLFLRELYDEDCFVFFLYGRSLISKRLGLQFADLKHRVLPDSVSRLCLPEGAVLTAPYPSLADGTKSTFVSYDQAAWLVKTIVAVDNPHSMKVSRIPQTTNPSIHIKTKTSHNSTHSTHSSKISPCTSFGTT